MIYKRIKANIPKLIRFSLVGAVGAAINFAVYYWAVEFAKLSINLSAVLAFCVAIVNNYILNHRWTFARENVNNSTNFRQFTYYLVGNIQGLLINLAILNVLVHLAGTSFHLISQMLGILCGMLSNFIFAKKFVFSKNDSATHTGR